MPLDLTNEALSQKNIDPTYLTNFSKFLSKALNTFNLKESRRRDFFQETIDAIDRQLNIKRKTITESDSTQTLIVHHFAQTPNTEQPDIAKTDFQLVTTTIHDSKNNVTLLYNRLKYLADRSKLVLFITDDNRPKREILTLTNIDLYLAETIFETFAYNVSNVQLNLLRHELHNANLPAEVNQISFSRPYLENVPILESIMLKEVDSDHLSTEVWMNNSIIVLSNIILNQILS